MGTLCFAHPTASFSTKGRGAQPEANALSNSLYACELMVRCKEAAVCVSRSTWEQIEGRMLRPTQESSQFGF